METIQCGQLADRQITLETTPAARVWLSERGYDKIMGARPLQRVIRERGHEDLFDELMRQASAAAVRQHDAVVSDSRDRTAQVERSDFDVCHSDSRPRTRLRTIPWERRADFPAYTSRQMPGSHAAS